MFKKLKNKKGFTLVELIVVLVILAILAALLVPALTGYIDKAKEKSIEAKTRNIVMATQTLIDEQYGKVALSTPLKADVNIGDATSIGTDGTVTVSASEISNLAEVTVKTGGDANVTGVTINVSSTTGAMARITKLIYEENGKSCTYSVDSTTGNATFATT